MKVISTLLVILILAFALFPSCRKDKFISNSEALLGLSADTLRFDTVFTTAGSITGSVKIYNTNQQRLRINSISLAGGSASAYRMNADGTASSEVHDLELAAGDSLYVFVTVSINPNSASMPFLVRDSLIVRYGTQESKVQLEAYGQNAHFLRQAVIGTDEVWNNDLPYVILGALQVDTGVTLKIKKGTRIYCHADGAIIVDGTLQAEGSLKDSIVFRGDRLDEGYRDLPASWPGIFFRSSSRQNMLTHVRILNAYQGIVADGLSNDAAPKIELRECVIDNCYNAGIIGYHSSIHARNCLISNCGSNIELAAGGDYHFQHCNSASYSTFFAIHDKPVLLVTNWDSINNQLVTWPIQVLFENCIFWGGQGTVDDEVIISRKGTNIWSAKMDHSLYKSRTDPTDTDLINCLKNEDPLFDNIDVGKMIFDFHLTKNPSPALNKGIPSNVIMDLDDQPRSAIPDIGCYEKQ